MTQFRARRKGMVQAELPPYAATLIASLARQLVELLSDGEATLGPTSDDPLEALLDFDAPREAPEDPALLRLLPPGFRDDDEAAAEFRRFTERSLREAKVADALAVLESVGDVSDEDIDDIEFELDPTAVRSWLRCLTDMRLTLAERLGVTADDEAYWESLPTDDPKLPVYEIYGWLGYLLESLLDAAQH
jgi:hypothetical protein